MAALAYTVGKREINHYFSVRSAKALALGAVLLLAACHAAFRHYRGEGRARRWQPRGGGSPGTLGSRAKVRGGSRDPPQPRGRHPVGRASPASAALQGLLGAVPGVRRCGSRHQRRDGPGLPPRRTGAPGPGQGGWVPRGWCPQAGVARRGRHRFEGWGWGRLLNFAIVEHHLPTLPAVTCYRSRAVRTDCWGHLLGQRRTGTPFAWGGAGRRELKLAGVFSQVPALRTWQSRTLQCEQLRGGGVQIDSPS